MTKEELKFVIYTEYCRDNKLATIRELYNILKCNLKRSKDLIDKIYIDSIPNPKRFIFNFNIMWKYLTKEEKLTIKNYKYA